MRRSSSTRQASGRSCWSSSSPGAGPAAVGRAPEGGQGVVRAVHRSGQRCLTSRSPSGCSRSCAGRARPRQGCPREDRLTSSTNGPRGRTRRAATARRHSVRAVRGGGRGAGAPFQPRPGAAAARRAPEGGDGARRAVHRAGQRRRQRTRQATARRAPRSGEDRHADADAKAANELTNGRRPRTRRAATARRSTCSRRRARWRTLRSCSSTERRLYGCSADGGRMRWRSTRLSSPRWASRTANWQGACSPS